MEFTGERYLPSIGGELRMEHMHRYAFCIPYVKNKVVLDAACGEGYGSALLATSAAAVTGIDISEEAVLAARRRYANTGQKLSFEAGDATALTLPEHHFDVVVSFETIEHVLQQDALLAGFSRVLKRDGLLILSSPDKRTYSDEPQFRNEFHVKELYLDELQAILGRHFKRHSLLGQRLAGGSAIFPLNGPTARKESRSKLLVDDGTITEERSARLIDPVYLLAIATNGPRLPPVHSSVLLSEKVDPLLELKRIARWASGVDTEMNELRAASQAELARLREALSLEQERSAALATASEESAAHHTASITKAQNEIAAMRERLADDERQRAQVIEKQAEDRSDLTGRLNTLLLKLEVEREKSALLEHEVSSLQENLARQQSAWHADQLAKATETAALRTQLEVASASAATAAAEHKSVRQEVNLLRERQAAALESWSDERLSLMTQLSSARTELDVERTAASAAATVASRHAAEQEAQWIRRLDSQANDWQSRLDTVKAQFEQQLQRHAQMLAEQREAAEAVIVQVRREHQDVLARAHATSRDEEQRLRAELVRSEQAYTTAIEALQAASAEQQCRAEVEIERWRSATTEARQQLHQAQLALQRSAETTASAVQVHREQMSRQHELFDSTCRNVRQSVLALSQALGVELESLRLTGLARHTEVRRLLPVLQQILEGLHGLARSVDGPESGPQRHGADTWPGGLAELLSLDDVEFLQQAYLCILHRKLDEDGRKHYLHRLRQGAPRLRVLSDLRLSAEGRQKAPLLADLDPVLRSWSRSRVPLLGRREQVRLYQQLAAPHRLKVRTAEVESAPAAAPMARIEAALTNLERGSSFLAEAVPIAVALGRAPSEFGLDPWSCAQELVRANEEDFINLAYALLFRRPPSADQTVQERARLESGASRVYLLNLLLEQALHEGTQSTASIGIPRSMSILALGSGAKLRTDPAPSVSLVIFGATRLDRTIRCLQSIIRHPPTTPYEVILVEPDDESAAALSSTAGLRVLRAEGATGVAASCQLGASAAKGEWLYFLHADAEVHTGWLDELRQTFEIFPGTGAVCSQLKSASGNLLAAGYGVWDDGTVGAIGNGSMPDESRYAFAREVDACSVASMMLPRHLYEAIGGMEKRLKGAEGPDLSLALADRGYRVMYQPRSRITLHRHATQSDTDEADALDASTSTAAASLLARWGTVLQSYPAAGIPARRAHRHRTTGSLLAIEHRLPRPDRDAGSVTVFNMLMAARELGLEVRLIAEADVAEGNEAEVQYVALLQRSGIEVLLGPPSSRLHDYLSAHGAELDVVVMFRPIVMERHAAAVARLCPRAIRLYYPHDLHFLRRAREAAILGDTALASTAEQGRISELALHDGAHLTLVASAAELQLLKEAGYGEKSRWLPLFLDTTRSDKPASSRRGMLFVGGFKHPPNVDAAWQLVEDILPRIRDRRPDIELWIVGESPPSELTTRNDAGVRYLGAVPDLNALMGEMLLALAPLRFGAGAKGKVARALSAGLPVVASPIAIEGMGLEEGQHLLVAENADAFAECVFRLHDQPDLWQQLSDAGHRYAVDHWGPKAAAAQLKQILLSQGIAIADPRFRTRFFNEAVHLCLFAS